MQTILFNRREIPQNHIGEELPCTWSKHKALAAGPGRDQVSIQTLHRTENRIPVRGHGVGSSPDPSNTDIAQNRHDFHQAFADHREKRTAVLPPVAPNLGVGCHTKDNLPFRILIEIKIA